MADRDKPTLTIEIREGYESEDSPGELVGKVAIGYDTGKSGFQILNISQAEAITFRMTQSSRAWTRWRGRRRARRMRHR